MFGETDGAASCPAGRSAALERADPPVAAIGISTRSGRDGPMRRKMRHFLETGSNRSMCRPIVSDGPRKRKPPSLREKCSSEMTFFWTSGSR